MAHEEHVAGRLGVEQRQDAAGADGQQMSERAGAAPLRAVQQPRAALGREAGPLGEEQHAFPGTEVALQAAHLGDGAGGLGAVAADEDVGNPVAGDVEAGLGQQLLLEHVAQLQLEGVGDEGAGEQHVDEARVADERDVRPALREGVLFEHETQRAHRGQQRAGVAALDGEGAGVARAGPGAGREEGEEEAQEAEVLDEQEDQQEQHEPGGGERPRQAEEVDQQGQREEQGEKRGDDGQRQHHGRDGAESADERAHGRPTVRRRGSATRCLTGEWRRRIARFTICRGVEQPGSSLGS